MEIFTRRIFSLLKPFPKKFIGYAGDKQFPHTVIGIGWKENIQESELTEFIKGYEEWRKNQAMVLIREYEMPNEEE